MLDGQRLRACSQRLGSTETDRNGPKRTETDRNGPKRSLCRQMFRQAAESSEASRASPLSRAHMHREEPASAHSSLSKESAVLPGGEVYRKVQFFMAFASQVAGRALSPMSRAHDGDRRSSDAGLRRPSSECCPHSKPIA